MNLINQYFLFLSFFQNYFFLKKKKVLYLSSTRGISNGFTQFILFSFIFLQFTCSFLAIAKIKTPFAVGGLFLVILIQTFIYKLFLNATYLLRGLSVLGGLLILLSEGLNQKKSLFAGIPQLEKEDFAPYLQLLGRILLVCLFIALVLGGELTITRIIFSIFGFVACILVVIGFKAQYTAIVLVSVLCILNVFLNNWWSLHSTDNKRDFLKYDFFQTLSIVGGLLLLANHGPGNISLDYKKKF